MIIFHPNQRRPMSLLADVSTLALSLHHHKDTRRQRVWLQPTGPEARSMVNKVL